MKSKHKNTVELQEVLVQAVINYLKENNIENVDGVSFLVDGLEASVAEGKWHPSTDSSLTLTGIKYDKNGVPMRYDIDSSY